MNIKNHLFLITVFLLTIYACSNEPEHNHEHGTNYVTKLKDLKKVDAGNGEFIYQMEGKDYDFNSLSFAITETHPGGGPALHTHEKEEAHILLDGKVTYFINDSIFTVTGPYVVNVPPGVPHTFINSDDTVINLIAVFPEDNFGAYNPIGKNPLFEAIKTE